MKVKFGIKFLGKWDYTHSEVSNFIECADNIEPLELRNRYTDFLKLFVQKKIKPSTLVDYDVLGMFQGDIDNRAQMDFREGQYDMDHDGDAKIILGGQYFDTIAKKLKVHLDANKVAAKDVAKCTEFTKDQLAWWDEIEAGIQQAIEDDCQERGTTQAQDLEDDMLERDAYQDAMEKRWGQR